MTTLYLLGDRSQPLEIRAGVVIGRNWKVFDGSGKLFCAYPDRARAEATFNRLKTNRPKTAWRLEETI